MSPQNCRIDESGQTVIYTKAVVCNRQAAVLEIRFNRVTKLGRYELRLARSGYIAQADGGMEWDALARLLRKYSWSVGEPAPGQRCGLCGGLLRKLPHRNKRQTAEGWVRFSVYMCTEKRCGATWEGEFERV